MNPGFFEIGIIGGKTPENLGTLWRSAFQLGAVGIFTIGKRYKFQPSDTPKTPNQIPLREFATFEEWKAQRPNGAVLIGVEMGGVSLSKFSHPKNAVYLLGAEDSGIPKAVKDHCNQIVSLDSIRMNSFNVAVAGSLVMYSRMVQLAKI